MGDPTVTTRRQSFHISKSEKPSKEIRFGSYVLGSTLGEGEFGKVKLGWKKDGSQPSQAAIKFIRRDSIPRGSERESKVHREINALKRLSHPNIVTLEEVLQNDKYIGIVLEYASGGELFDYILQHRYLKDSLACRLFSQLVSGVHYMHSKGIVHRDLKLENLLLDKHKNIIITDFGFVNSFGPHNDLMKTSCGSPCYAAPELVISNEPYESRKVDVWSCGVILYAILAGYLPFDDDPQNPDGDNIARLYQYITSTHLTFPEYIEPMPRDLLRRILVPNPRKRLTLREVRGHQWLTPHAPFLSVTPAEWDKNYKTNNENNADIVKTQRNLIKNDIRRYSLIDTTSSSFQNHNSSSHFFANPLPPHTSSNHAIALPSSTPSTSISEQIKFSPRMHQRSNSVQSYSSATIALQAVVDADEIRNISASTSPTLANSLTSVDIKQQRQRRNSDGKNSLPLSQSLPRSTTHTGITTLGGLKESSAIKEPIQEQQHHYHQSQLPLDELSKKNCDFVTPKIPKTSDNYHQPSNNNQKLPGPGARKPRPTSYHPGLYSMTGGPSSSNQFFPPGFDIHDPSTHSPVIRSESTNSIASLTNGKISQPSVDLSLANGDIIKPKSPCLLATKNFNTSNNFDESEEEVFEKPSRTDEVHNNTHDSNKSTTEKERDGLNKSANKKNRYSAVIAAEIVMDKLFGTNSHEIEPKENTQPLANSPSHTSSIHSSHSNPSNISAGTKNTSVQDSSENQLRKHSTSSKVRTSLESTNKNTTNSTNSSKTKRFSFLGFYTIPPISESEPPQQQASKPSNRKVLGPSNDANIVRKTNVDKDKRKSTFSYTTSKKEPSTAKKVMDFFKRRSMRVG